MANTMVSFKRGSDLSKLAIADGQFIVNTAERSIYVDVGTERLRIGDFVSVANTEALPTAGANETALYYVEDINCLAKWNGTGWTQINRDSGAVNFTVTGDGNAITNVSYDAKTRTLTLTKGVTFTTPAVVDSKISTAVGTLGNDAEGNAYTNVKAYVDAKTSGIATDASLSALTKRVDAAEVDIDALQAATAEGGAVSNAIADAKKAGTEAKAAADAAKAAAETAQATADSKVTMAEVEKKNYATKAEAQGYANAKDEAIAAAKAAADAAQADVDALEGKVGTVTEGKTVVGLIGTAQAAADAAQSAANAAQTAVDALSDKVGTVTEGKTVVQMIDEAKTAATYDDTEVRGLISDNAEAIEAHKTAIDAKVTTLIGEDSDKSVRTIASEETAKIVAGADASFDTLKEIADWISTHKTDAAAMNSAIITLEDIVDGIGGEGEKATVVAYVTDAIAALKIGDYAKAADLAALAARVEALKTTVGKTAEGGNPATGLIKDIADNKTAIANEKARAEGAESTLSGRIDTLEAIDHSVYALKTDVASDKATLEGKINANTSAIGTLNGADTVEGSVAKKIKDAIAAENLSQYATDTELSALDARVVTVEGKAHTHDNKAELDKIATGDKAKWDAVVEDHLVAADKTALENAIATKANSADVYTKTEVDAKLTDALSWGEF